MATPLSPYANARMLLQLPGERGGADTGYKRTAGESVVVLLFLKQSGSGGDNSSGFKQVTNASVASDALQGYVVAFAPLPTGEDWLELDVAAAEGADTSGKRPAALRKGARPIALQFGSRVAQSLEVTESASIYDDEGIGSIVRNVIGDRMILQVEWRQ